MLSPAEPFKRPISLNPPLGLADRAIANVRARFAEWKHYPSEANWRGLEAIARTFEAMANGDAKTTTYLSSEPPGTGKTTMLVECLVELATNPKYRGVGAVIFLNTLDAIETLVKELRRRGVAQEQIAIEIGKGDEQDRIRQLGRGEFRTKRNGDEEWKSEHEDAQILVCTQQKLLSIVRAGRRDFETFWRCFPGLAFKRSPAGEITGVEWVPGYPRAVRIWDEAILPAESLVTTTPEIVEFITGGELGGLSTDHSRKNRITRSQNRREITTPSTAMITDHHYTDRGGSPT